MDQALQEMKSFLENRGDLSFDDIRGIAKDYREYNVWNELGRGRSILSTYDQLNQYMHSYAPMIRGHWKKVLSEFEFPNDDVEIIDYGCGQGLASILFLDKYHEEYREHISKFILIEPSKLAIKRAEGILNCYDPQFKIDTINKSLDDVTMDDLELDHNKTKVHLFSNILDVEGFEVQDLFDKILMNEGRHCFLAVSHHRYSHGGSERVEEIYNLLSDNNSVDFRLIGSTMNIFQTRGFPSIFFRVILEV
jgi:hypothetical protein